MLLFIFTNIDYKSAEFRVHKNIIIEEKIHNIQLIDILDAFSRDPRHNACIF